MTTPEAVTSPSRPARLDDLDRQLRRLWSARPDIGVLGASRELGVAGARCRPGCGGSPHGAW